MNASTRSTYTRRTQLISIIGVQTYGSIAIEIKKDMMARNPTNPRIPTPLLMPSLRCGFDDDDDSDVYGGDDSVVSPTDFTACSLQDCGYCGHCDY